MTYQAKGQRDSTTPTASDQRIWVLGNLIRLKNAGGQARREPQLQHACRSTGTQHTQSVQFTPGPSEAPGQSWHASHRRVRQAGWGEEVQATLKLLGEDLLYSLGWLSLGVSRLRPPRALVGTQAITRKGGAGCGVRCRPCPQRVLRAQATSTRWRAGCGLLLLAIDLFVRTYGVLYDGRWD